MSASTEPVPASPDLSRRFGGIGRLYGITTLQGFESAHIAVVGIGGVGSWAAEALARSGIGKITLIDLDNVAESNVNRQIHALDGNFGKAKVSVMAERIQAINPNCRVNCIEDFVAPDNIRTHITREFNWVVDCIDAFRVKAALIAHCRRNKIKIVTVGGAGGRSDPSRIKLADLSKTEQDPLLARTRKLLRDQYGFSRNPKRRFAVPVVYSDEQPVFPTTDGEISCDKGRAATASGLHCAGGIGSAMTVTATFGLFATSVVLNKLACRGD